MASVVPAKSSGSHEKPQHVEDQTPEERLRAIEAQLFSKYSLADGMSISRAWRAQQKGLRDPETLAYGEIKLMAFYNLMQKLKDYEIIFGEHATFVDVGSGFGKLIIVVNILATFKKATGIEIVGPLHRKAVEMQMLFSKNFRNPLDQCEMELVNGDGTYVDWSGASLVFIHATNFDPDMMRRVTATAQKMLLESVVMIVNNRLLEERNFELVRIVEVELTYGFGQLFIYRKMLRGQSARDAAALKLKEVLNRPYSL